MLVLLVPESAERGYDKGDEDYNADANQGECQHVKAEEYCGVLLLCLYFFLRINWLRSNYRSCWLFWLCWFDNFFIGELTSGIEGDKAELGDFLIGVSSKEAD